MLKQRTIVLVLRSGGDFGFRDVELIVRHIRGKWMSKTPPRIVCLWDKASECYDLGNIEFVPLKNDWRGTWSRIELYSPEMEQFRPFLYVDLDTIIVNSIEHIFDLIRDVSQFITLEDFWQLGKLATGLVWFPANSEKVRKVWEAWKGDTKKSRMDSFLREVIVPDQFWQKLTSTIYDFKPSPGKVLTSIPSDANLVCFHGKPRIFAAGENSMSLKWIRDYILQERFEKQSEKREVTVIIPYNKDRGYLQDAIRSVPDDVQLIVSQGEGNWPENFNKALPQAKGRYIKYLHEDDMLTENCIWDSVQAIETQKVDFIHGNAIELIQSTGKLIHFRPRILRPTLGDMLKKNYLHSATLMYRREVFDVVGGFDETLNVCEEYEFNLRCLQFGLKLGYCPSYLAIYRRHAEQKIKVWPQPEQSLERKTVKTKYK